VTSASIFSLSSSAARAAKLARRLRASQPSPLEVDQPSQARRGVDAFLDRLIELPLAEWLAIGELIVVDRDHVPVRRRAWDELEAKLRTGRLGVAAWSIRDAVDTAAYIATCESHRWTRHERGAFAAAHGAAEAAALALLARDDLPAEIYRSLTAPFAACVAGADSTHSG
jgi:hypothetical protein